MATNLNPGDRVRVAPHVKDLAGMLGTVVERRDGYPPGRPVLLDEDSDQLPVPFDDADLVKAS